MNKNLKQVHKTQCFEVVFMNETKILNYTNDIVRIFAGNGNIVEILPSGKTAVVVVSRK